MHELMFDDLLANIYIKNKTKKMGPTSRVQLPDKNNDMNFSMQYQ